MSFDLSNVKPQGNFEVLPAGKYICNVTNAELKDTRDGTGQYIKMEYTIKSEVAEGRKIFSNLNIKNNNPKATDIGLSQLRSLLELSGYPTPDKLGGVSELCGLTVGVKTKVKSDLDFGDRAEVSYFFDPKKDSQSDQKATPDLPF